MPLKAAVTVECRSERQFLSRTRRKA